MWEAVLWFLVSGTLTSEVTEQFFQDLGEAAEVAAEAWSRRRWTDRLFEWVGSVVGRWV